MMSVGWSVESVVEWTQQLLLQLGPLLASSGGQHNAASLLVQLQEMDLITEGRSSALQSLYSVLAAQFGDQVLQAVANSQLTAGSDVDGPLSQQLQQQQATWLLDSLSAQPVFQQLRRQLARVSNAAARELLDNCGELRDRMALTSVGETPAFTTAGAAWPLVDDSALLNSSVAGSWSLFGSLNRVLLLNASQLERVAATLQSADSDEEERCESLHALSNAFAAGALSAEMWRSVKPAVERSLMDPSDQVAERALQLIARLLVGGDSESQVFAREAYLCLLEVVCDVYSSDVGGGYGPMNGDEGFSSDVLETRRVLQLLSVLHRYQLYVSRLWLRFSERLVQELIENTVDMLTLGVPPGGPRSLDEMFTLPLARLALVDTGAAWFSHWMRCEWSRRWLLAALRRSTALLTLAVSVMRLWTRRHDSCPTSRYAEDGRTRRQLVVVDAVGEACHAHCVYLLLGVCQYRAGLALFPLAVGSGSRLTVPELIIEFIQQSCASDGELVRKAFMEAVRSSIALQEACGDATVLDYLADALKLAFDDYSVDALAVVQIVLALGESEIGVKYMTATDSDGGDSLASIVCETAPRALQRGQVMTTTYSLLLQSICMSHAGVQTLLESQALSVITGECLLMAESDLELSERRSRLGSSPILPLCVSLLRFPRALCLLAREHVLGFVLEQLEQVEPPLRDGSLEMLPCLRESAVLLNSMSWFSHLCTSLCADLDSPDVSFLQQTDAEPFLDQMHTLTVWAATAWGVWLLMRSSTLLGDAGITAALCDPYSDTWLCLLAWISCSHLDGRVLLLAAVREAHPSIRVLRLEDIAAGIIDEAAVLRCKLLACLDSVEPQQLSPAIDATVRQFLDAPSIGGGERSGVDRGPSARGRRGARRSHVAAPRRVHELARFLADRRATLHDVGWLRGCRKALRATLLSSPLPLRRSQLAELLDQLCELPGGALDSQLTLPSEDRPGAGAPALPLTVDAVAADLALKYGQTHRLVAANAQTSEALLSVLRYARRLCGEHSTEDSTCVQPGVHWFAAVVFLIYSGSQQRCRRFLTAYCSVPGSVLAWPGRGRRMCAARDLCRDELLVAGVLHQVGVLLERELPAVHGALQLARLPLVCVCASWLRQCYLGVLSWSEVCHYLALVTTLGADFCVYFTLAVLRHVEPLLLTASGRPVPLLSVATQQIQDFNTRRHLSFMETICRRHRRAVLADLNSCLSQCKWDYSV